MKGGRADVVGTKRNSSIVSLSLSLLAKRGEKEVEERSWRDERERERWRKGVWEMREKEEQEERRIALITRSWRKKEKKKKRRKKDGV